jgi:hypothetical protein
MMGEKIIEIEGIRLNAAAIREIEILQLDEDYPKKSIRDAMDIIFEFAESGHFLENSDNVLVILSGLNGIEKMLETMNVRKEVASETV